MRSSQWLLSLFLLRILTPSDAGADDADTQSELIDDGIRLRREHRDAEALQQFQRAQEMAPSPRTLAQVALAEQALGQWDEAERDLGEALEARDDPWIAGHADVFRTTLDFIRQHLGTISVDANVDGAELWMDGSLVGKLPISKMRVAARTAQLELRATGYQTVVRPMELAASESLTLRVEFVKPAAAAIPDVPVMAPPIEHVPSPGASTPRTYAWILMGGAAAMLGGALVAQVVQLQKAAHYNDDSLCFYGDLTRDERCGIYRGQAETAQRVANIGYIAAGTLGIASAVLFLAWPDRRPDAIKGARIEVRATGAQIGYVGEF